MNVRHILLGVIAAAPAICNGANIDRSTLTEVVNNVRIVDAGSKKSSAAKVQTEFVSPNVLRTGPDSRAEMVAPDETVTRVGQNTIFSFAQDSRNIELQKGSILFQSPTGKGGGTIRTPAASAAVLGTTLIVSATPNGGFKVLLVEGKGKVTAADGSVRRLAGGQMVYALPGGKLSGVFEFRLSQQVAASTLLGGFKKKLASSGKIEAAIKKQEKDIASGKALDTGLLASGSPSFAYKIDVAFDALVQQQTGDTAVQTRFQAAAATDAIISTPTLDAQRVFAPGDADPIEFPGDSRPFLLSSDEEDGVIFTRARNGAQFIGSNVLFDSPTISLQSFASNDVVRFLSLNDVLFNQSVDFGSYPGVLQFWAGGTIQGPRGQAISVRVAAAELTFAAFGSAFSVDKPLPDSFAALSLDVPLRLSGFTAENTEGTLVVIAGTTNMSGVRFGGQQGLLVAARQDVLIAGANGVQPIPLAGDSEVSGFPNFSVLASNHVAAVTAGRDVDLRQTAVRAPQIRVKAGQDVKLTAVQINDLSTPPEGSSETPLLLAPGQGVRISAQRIAELNGVNFAANQVTVQARTVNLSNVFFRNGSLVILESQRGQLAPNPNTGRPALPGYVNFIRNVRYGDGPAENFVFSGGGSTGNNGPGIVIRRRSN